MPLVVEDGTGLANAEAYISVADATTYHAARGNAAWAGFSDSLKEQLLRKATEYMQQMYRTRWLSYRTTNTQALDWPRAEVPLYDAPRGYGAFSSYVPNNIVPVEVQRACAELALIANDGALAPVQDRVTVSEKVGPIEVQYDPSRSPYKTYPHVDRMLMPYLGGSSISMKVVRS